MQRGTRPAAGGTGPGVAVLRPLVRCVGAQKHVLRTCAHMHACATPHSAPHLHQLWVLELVAVHHHVPGLLQQGAAHATAAL